MLGRACPCRWPVVAWRPPVFQSRQAHAAREEPLSLRVVPSRDRTRPDNENEHTAGFLFYFIGIMLLGLYMTETSYELSVGEGA